MYKELKTYRSIRKYKDKPVEREKLDDIIKSALIAPSSRNRKPWEFILVQDKKVLNAISRCKPHGASFAKDAPAAVVVLADPKKCDVWVEDCSIAAYTIQLVARSLGLGSCWIQTRLREMDGDTGSEEYLKELLGIPEGFAVECVITIGYGDEIKPEYTEEDMDFGKVHKDFY
ncbi:nitroreductase family protein [Alkalibacter saccharofermentans]|uniref:Nitroreductase n=1 Tax=Alkalibacter saccharofermentans DSM 14828 TaxID=1120975 RepID=A0A1M4VES5_9FIRM|nr:nitroreductase family protein [Alkalibacter saccharofermentans]SHE67408.1 Nitroreductase [Alkalibacter saccharofermentans DSM 14828]